MSAELNKLNKSQLIDIIIRKVIPEGVTVSEDLQKCILESPGCSDREENDIVEIRSQNKILSIENSYLKILLKEVQEKNIILMQNNDLLVEKMARNQIESKKIINDNITHSKKVAEKEINKEKGRNINVTRNAERNIAPNYAGALGLPSVKDSVPNPKLTFSLPSNIDSSSAVNKQRSLVLETKESNDESANATTKEWKIVTNRRKRSKLICTGSKKANTIIKGVPRKRWVYVGRIEGKDTSEQDISDYLNDIEGHEDIEVKKLRTVGKNAAFSVGVPSERLFDIICDPELWPEGVVIREFSFRNFFRQQSTSDTHE